MPLHGRKKVDAMFADKVEDLDRQVRAIWLEGLEAISIDTPVDNGRARNNWFLSMDEPTKANITRKDDPSGSGSISQLSRIATYRNVLNRKVYFVNNLPYIERLEYEGWSQQAPAGMVRINLTRMAAAIRNVK